MNIRRPWILLAGLAGLALFGAELYSQSPAARDVWYEYMDGDVRYGFRHVVVVRLEDGNYRYFVEMKVLIDLFGVQKQEATSRAEYVVTPQLRPVSLTAEMRDLSGASSVRGFARDDTFVVQIHREGSDREIEVAIDGTGSPVFSVCQPDRLSMLPAATEQATVRELDEARWSIETFTASREPTETDRTAWRVETGAGIGDRTLTFGPDGVLQEVSSEVPSLLMRRSTKERAIEIVHRNMTGRELLTFPLDKPIRAPERLRRLAVRLRWKDIPLDELDLEDSRQTIASHEVDGDGHNVVLELAEPPPIENASEITIPVSDEAFAQYLAESYYIKPTHPEIVAAARATIQDEHKALPAVRALCDFVARRVEGELVARTLSGPEVLAARRGKCTEYSTLFASLARSVGIPTRIVLGERLAAGQWMGHMWNEAYVGRWVTVDASAGEVDRSFALLKFVDSDTVDGTQPVRWKLTKSLSISVENFDLVPSELEQKFVTGIVEQTYTSTDYACSIEAPGDGWTLLDKSTPEAVTIRFEIKDGKSVHIHFVPFAIPEGTQPEVLIAARIKMWRGHYEHFEVLENQGRAVAGANGHTSRLRGKREKASKSATATTEVLWVRGNHGYLLNLIAPEAAHDAQLANFGKLLQGFRFLD